MKKLVLVLDGKKTSYEIKNMTVFGKPLDETLCIVVEKLPE